MIKINSEPNSRLILWDIDGTLVRLKRADSSSPHKNALFALDYSFNQFNFELSGLTDYEVLISLAKSSEGKIDRKRILTAFNNLDEESRRLDKVSTFDLYPGVQEILESLISLGWDNGILSGNTRSRIVSKLDNTGLTKYFTQDLIFGCEFGDSRENIANKAREFLQFKKYSNVLILGDTPNDIAAARAVGFPVISVATGNYSFTQLSTYKPDLLLQDLTKDAEVLFSFLK